MFFRKLFQKIRCSKSEFAPQEDSLSETIRTLENDLQLMDEIIQSYQEEAEFRAEARERSTVCHEPSSPVAKGE